jgi:branched-subunit amino acid aminotransferase/4-amino-4-deoxychorismate lyase
MARREWEDQYHEGLLSNPEGNVVEGCSSNLFLVTEEGLLTPDLAVCGVQGVMRRAVLAHAEARGTPCRVGPVSRDSLARAREVFLTNAVLGIVPVRAIEGRAYGPRPITTKLMSELPRGMQS